MLLLLSFDVGTFCCLFLMLSIFPQTQTGQSSNNFPWFFDLFTSFRRTAPTEDVFTFFSFDRRCLLFVGCFFRFRRHAQLPKLSIRNKFVMKMLFCTIIVVIMSNHIRRITLNLLCTVTCCVGSTDIIFFKC